MSCLPLAATLEKQGREGIRPISTLRIAQLTVTRGDSPGKRYSLKPGQTFVVGRSAKVAVRLVNDSLVSRQHASIELRRDGLFIVDLGSRNGTYIDGLAVPPNTPIEAPRDTVLQVGDHIIEIRILGTGFHDDEDDETTVLTKPALPHVEFEILGQIGEGTTGRVFAAEQKLLRRRVAIKVLKSELVGNAEERERFTHAGWITSQIESPHVVDVYDVRIVANQVYLILELVQGPCALDLLKQGPLPFQEVLRIGEHVSRALQAAAEAGIVHRDIKPSNILLDPSGIAKLTDFGIAKSLLEEGTPRAEGGDLSYSSPEQTQDVQMVNVRSDIYALGATLYHLLSGTPPFEPQSRQDLYESIGQDPRRLESFDIKPTPPRVMIELIHSMMSQDPVDRPYPPSVLARDFHNVRVDVGSAQPRRMDDTGPHVFTKGPHEA